MGEPETAAPRERQPWPMTWVVIAIASYIVLYTAINLGFRKPGPAHEPAAGIGVAVAGAGHAVPDVAEDRAGIAADLVGGDSGLSGHDRLPRQP